MIDAPRYLALLDEMTRQAGVLQSALLREREAMAGYDSRLIKQRLTEKLEALKALEGNVSQRQLLLSQAGVSQDADGHHQLLAQLDPTWREQIETAASNAEAAIETCQQANRSNAAVLQRIKHKADTIKSIIAGSNGQTLYGAKGKTTSPRMGRALGNA